MSLPTAFLIGARRSGTTSLAAALADHPQIFVSSPKESHYFTRARSGELPAWLDPTARRVVPHDIAEYEHLFDYARPEQVVRLDASTSYLEDHRAAARIAKLVPNAQIIVSLRQPVDQAFSIWKMWHGGRAPVDHPIERFLAAFERPPMQYPLAEHGLFSQHLRPYYDAFPRSCIRVLLYDDLIAEPAARIGSLLAWLGVNPDVVPPLRHRNASGDAAVPLLQRLLAGSSPAKRLARRLLPDRAVRWLTDQHHRLWSANVRPDIGLSPILRDTLTRIWYEAEIEALEAMIDRDLTSWKAHGTIRRKQLEATG